MQQISQENVLGVISFYFYRIFIMLRQFSILFLCAIVLFSSIGANLYELCCDCEGLHEISLFSKHHTCKNETVKITAKGLHPCCVKKLLSEKWQQGFHKKKCCDFSAKYLLVDAKYNKSEKTNIGTKKKIAPNKESKNTAILAAFSEQPALLAQRLGGIMHVKNLLLSANSYISNAFGRLMRIRLASFLC